jgi:hypothetical protein
LLHKWNNRTRTRNLTWQRFLWSYNTTCLTFHMITMKYKLITHCIWWFWQIYYVVLNFAHMLMWMIFWHNISFSTNLMKHFIKIFELYDQLLSNLNNRPYLSYEWKKEMRKKHMNQSIVGHKHGKINNLCSLSEKQKKKKTTTTTIHWFWCLERFILLNI